MKKILREVVIICSVFIIAFGAKKVIAQDYPIYACSKEQAVALRGEAINCNAVLEVIDALQAQIDFIVKNRLSWETETTCGKSYAVARRLLEEDRPALRKRSPELLEKCSKAIADNRK